MGILDESAIASLYQGKCIFSMEQNVNLYSYLAE